MSLDSDVVIGGAKGATSVRPELDRGAQAAGAEEPRSESTGPFGSLHSGRGGPGDEGRAGSDLRPMEARGTSDAARDAHRSVRAQTARAALEEVDGRARVSIGSIIRRRRGRRRRPVPVEGARVAEQTALVVAASRPGAEGPYGGDRGAPALDAEGALSESVGPAEALRGGRGSPRSEGRTGSDPEEARGARSGSDAGRVARRAARARAARAAPKEMGRRA